ncbi:hypothetical protein FRB96_003463 [Tulasnella sp. 330]|nr:hypothetical protein FRB96_003463 [Tulasnella sp. 330]KAG8880978.1 hypothetical protein FRB97_000302 [Tulasnella sp. 331]KAG8888917.1 hypothetical protein FRB98_006459 [Tulasnella sp. 332]
MAPKKAQKMNLTDFLQDSSLGSWADEMDSLPSAPAVRTDEDRSRGRDFSQRGVGFNDDYSGRESRYPQREELPLPTAPPYTAYVGNLAFDIREDDVEEFFGTKLKSVKIIKDKDEKPKGFGYVEFDTLQDLKDGLTKSGTQLASRAVRVSVAEPPKGREGRDGGFDDDKFAGPWRRDGPLPPSNDRGSGGGFRGGSSRYDDGALEKDRGERMGFGSRFVPSNDSPGRGGGPSRGGDREPPPGPTEAETNADWRAGSRPTRGPPTPVSGDRPGPPSRKVSGFVPHEGTHAADTDNVWQKGSKFSPSEPERPAFAAGKSSFFGRRESSQRPGEDEPSDWRSAPRKAPTAPATNNGGRSNERSPTGSVPSTPNMGRRKLELLPRTANQSGATSPVGSPKSVNPTAILARSNPFGDAKPVDAASREKEIEEKYAREREAVRAREKESKSNESSPRTRPADRPPNPRGPPTTEGGNWRDRNAAPPSSTVNSASSRPMSRTHSRATSNDGVAPSPTPSTGPASKKATPFSFAAIAGEVPVAEGEEDEEKNDDQSVNDTAGKVTELTV